MRDQSIPEDWSAGKPSKSGEAGSQFPNSQLPKTPGSQHLEDAASKRIPRLAGNQDVLPPVSYTHLTLPTIYSV